MSDTKDGRLVVATVWHPAGTEVRDVRLTKDAVQIISDALAILQPDTPDGWEAKEVVQHMLAWDSLEPDCLNDFTL